MPTSYQLSKHREGGRHAFMVRIPKALWTRLKHLNADRDEPLYLTIEEAMERGISALEKGEGHGDGN